MFVYGPEARKYLVAEGYDVEECGLFIDQEMPFLGANGLIGLEIVLETKCPYSASDILTKEEAIVSYLKRVNGEIKFAKDHSYYYQIQGQLHVTQLQKCLFLVYAMHWTHIEEIERKSASILDFVKP
ncbi:Cellulose synthase-like protein B5 [Frankliniella fusca]|uniref:Cellulose synthase-like protein B5 n=1 Tax=Frankliniella fusca TaxID=407009 RepID=A0AAE1HVI6_9NEOP|nr:Cellulose synthase-like protein B5 [Frankliniella fusca]